MNYRCPHCHNKLSIRKLFLKDISECKSCGQRVVLGDFLAFFMASIALFVTGMAVLWRVNYYTHDAIVSGGYALGAGIAMAILVLVLLGRAKPYRPLRFRATTSRAPLTQADGKPA